MQTSTAIQNHLRSFVEYKRAGVDDGLVEITPERHQDMLGSLAQILNRFSLDWKIMRAIMLTTGAVISGSAALAVLHEGKFVPQDLDIYVISKNMATILVFLLEQGYSVQIPARDSTINDYTKSNVILTLKNDRGDKIDLIATTEPHVVHAIAQFHSTCVMNYISYYGIVCMYPGWTMLGKALVKPSTNQQVIDKYRGRGFSMVFASEKLPGYEPNHVCGRHQCCPKTRRELQDHITLFIPLEEEGLSIRTEESGVVWVLDADYKCHVL